MDLQTEFNQSFRTLQQNLPVLQNDNFPDDAIVREIHRLFPEALVVISESPAAPQTGVTSTIQYGVNWHGFTFTITRKLKVR